jgi:hypothetical protein
MRVKKQRLNFADFNFFFLEEMQQNWKLIWKDGCMKIQNIL